MKSERKEILMRIVVAIVSGIILSIWEVFAIVLLVMNWSYTIFSGKRHKRIADMAEYWNTEMYKFSRYMILESNKRPFPFSEVEKMSKFEK